MSTLGKKHINKEKFRKTTHPNVDYSDVLTIYTSGGHKKYKYRKSCPICQIDMGHHFHYDAYRKCIRCQGDINRKNTPIQRRIKSSMKASIGCRLRRRLSSKNTTPTFKTVPYTLQELMKHLESLFTEGMSWDNYGKWHIDHIIPDSLFDYDSVDHPDFKKSWALTNLQPLWAKDNLRKSNKFNGDIYE